MIGSDENETGLWVGYRNADGVIHTVTVDYVLAATGRTPNTDKLGLENNGMVLNSQGVPVYHPRTMQTSEPHIFIAGDANNELPLLHEASDEGRIAGHNAGLYPSVESGRCRDCLNATPPWAQASAPR
ncbi:FAD-dependent oxidoreductase [Marinobacter sp. F4206]|uniref:FAD-dependent oxidoreductase n=1 Tax=Marinobacter sp. F4206 TaxID=2861777 RepID=UPI002150ADCF|nr:FAD-dependent oxidoreductase [Marinobacter sp. F4206]